MSTLATTRQSATAGNTPKLPNGFEDSMDISTSWPPTKPTRSRANSNMPMDPAEELARLYHAAERRKIQNRNAQRKYRRSLKKRLENLEDQQQNTHVGSRSGSNSSTTSDPSNSSRKHTRSSSSASSVTSVDTCPQDTMDTHNEPQPSQLQSQTSWPAQWDPMCATNGMMPPLPQIDDMFSTSLPQFAPQFESIQQQQQPSVEMGDPTTFSSYFDQYPHLNMGIGLAISEPSQTTGTPAPTSLSEHPQVSSIAPASLSLHRSMTLPCDGSTNEILHPTMGNSLHRTTTNPDTDMLHPCPSAPPSIPYTPNLRKSRSFNSPAPDTPTPAGGSPMHLAAVRGHDKIISLLAQQGADVNAADANGCTPLHLAVEHGHQGAVQVLLAAGADFRVKIA